jgi:hypothetical protein
MGSEFYFVISKKNTLAAKIKLEMICGKAKRKPVASVIARHLTIGPTSH